MSTSHAPVVIIAKEQHLGNSFDSVLPENYPVMHEVNFLSALEKLSKEDTCPMVVVLALCLCGQGSCKEEVFNTIAAFRGACKHVPILFITYGTCCTIATRDDLVQAGVTRLIDDCSELVEFLSSM